MHLTVSGILQLPACLFDGGLRNVGFDKGHGIIDKDAGGLAVGPEMDFTPLGGWGLRVDAGDFHGFSVGQRRVAIKGKFHSQEIRLYDHVRLSNKEKRARQDSNLRPTD